MHTVHPIWWTFAGAALFFCVLWVCLYRRDNRKLYVTFTPLELVRYSDGQFLPSGRRIDFDPRHGHYLKIAEIITTLASASLVFILTFNLETSRLFKSSMILLGLTVLLAVLFMVFLTYWYEDFLSRPADFKPFRSSLIAALGFSSLLCFAIAYVFLSIGAATITNQHPRKPQCAEPAQQPIGFDMRVTKSA